jgi:hypothetical protein
VQHDEHTLQWAIFAEILVLTGSWTRFVNEPMGTFRIVSIEVMPFDEVRDGGLNYASAYMQHDEHTLH